MHKKYYILFTLIVGVFCFSLDARADGDLQLSDIISGDGSVTATGGGTTTTISGNASTGNFTTTTTSSNNSSDASTGSNTSSGSSSSSGNPIGSPQLSDFISGDGSVSATGGGTTTTISGDPATGNLTETRTSTGSQTQNSGGQIFTDGFESGDTSAWTTNDAGSTSYVDTGKGETLEGELDQANSTSGDNSGFVGVYGETNTTPFGIPGSPISGPAARATINDEFGVDPITDGDLYGDNLGQGNTDPSCFGPGCTQPIGTGIHTAPGGPITFFEAIGVDFGDNLGPGNTDPSCFGPGCTQPIGPGIHTAPGGPGAFGTSSDNLLNDPNFFVQRFGELYNTDPVSDPNELPN